MANLDFHPFQDGFSINSTNEQGFSGSIGDRDKNTLVADGDVSTSGTKRNFFSFSFYQQFFDVDTDQVVKRVINSVVPTQNNFILDFVQPLPDLWGPFWISVTLIFSIGIFGNIAQYIESEGTAIDANVGSDFTLVTGASTLIVCYVFLVPLVLFGVLWHRKSDLQYPYIDLLCAYGYSLAVFIPVSVLWVLDIYWFRWALIFVAVSLSGGVLAKAVYPAFKNDSNKLIAFGSVISILLLHFLLAFTFKVYFFDAIHPARSHLAESSPVISPAASQTLKSEPSLPPSVLAATLPASNVGVIDNKVPAAAGESAAKADGKPEEKVVVKAGDEKKETETGGDKNKEAEVKDVKKTVDGKGEKAAEKAEATEEPAVTKAADTAGKKEESLPKND